MNIVLNIDFVVRKEKMSNHLLSVDIKEKFPTDSHYPFSMPVFNGTESISFETPITFFTGENGSGKSTMLEAIAHAAQIHIWRREETMRYEYNPYEKLLYRYITLNWSNGRVPGSYFGSENFNDFRRITDSWATSDPGQLKYFGGKSLVTQSHGQSIMSYFRARYEIEGIYFLDEPETALSPKSQIELLDILKENVKKGHAQFIIATHSPILLSLEGARILTFDHPEVKEIGYKETEHYKIYRKFLLER